MQLSFLLQLFDFDSYRFDYGYNESCVVNTETNTVTLSSGNCSTNGVTDAYTGSYNYPANYMQTIPGHSYRISFDYNADKAGMIDFMGFAYSSSVSTDYHSLIRPTFEVNEGTGS